MELNKGSTPVGRLYSEPSPAPSEGRSPLLDDLRGGSKLGHGGGVVRHGGVAIGHSEGGVGRL